MGRPCWVWSILFIFKHLSYEYEDKTSVCRLSCVKHMLSVRGFFNDNIVWRQCCEPRQPGTGRRGYDSCYGQPGWGWQLYGKPCWYSRHNRGKNACRRMGAGERVTRQQGHTRCRALRGAFSGTDDAPRRATSHYPCRYIGQRHLFPVDRFP